MSDARQQTPWTTAASQAAFDRPTAARTHRGESLFAFLGRVLRNYFAEPLEFAPRMARGELDRLLADDTRRRIEQARAAGGDWAGGRPGTADIAAECLLITPAGLLYAAELRRSTGTAGWAPVYFLATPAQLFEPIAQRLAGTRPLPVAAVDSRFGRDLSFASPLDGRLRRALDAHPVLRLAGAS